MELKEAIDTLKMLRPNLDFAVDVEAIDTVLQALEELQKENEKLREDSSLDEANIRADAMLAWDKHWENKIKEKIKELELQRSVGWCWEQQEEIKQIEVLEELLKGE